MRKAALRAIVVAALITGCAGGEEGEPPPMQLRAQEQTVRDRVGTYCTSGECADAAGPLGPRLVLASGPTNFAFDWEWDADILEVALCENRSFNNCSNAAEIQVEDEWPVDLRPGRFMVTVFATWAGGDASYEWFLTVR